MSAISSEPQLLQLVLVTFEAGVRHELNLIAPGAYKKEADTVYDTILEDVPEPSTGMVQIHQWDNLVWWYYVWAPSGDVLALRFADSGSELTEEETTLAKHFHDIVVDKDKPKAVDYEALFQKLAAYLK